MDATTPPSRKGAERKAKILDAALEIIGRDGLAELSMRTLATEAALPLGALGYYFPNKRQLIAEAFEAHLERELRRVLGAISSIGDAGSAIDLASDLAEYVIAGLDDAENELVAEYEFLVEASRRPELARSSSAWQHALRVQLRSVLEKLGSPESDADARLVMATIAGLEVDHLTRSRLTPAEKRTVTDTLTRLFEVLSTSWRSEGTRGEAR